MTPAELTEALGALPPFVGAAIGGLQRLSGGASMETWAFTAGGEEFILRRRAVAGGARTVSLAVEASLIRAAAAAGAPVPEVVYVAHPGDGVGEAHITRRLAGETLGRRIVSDAAFDAVRPTLARQCGEVLGHIHSSVADVALDTVDFLGELSRYEDVYRATGAQRPVLDLAFQTLRRRQPEPAGCVLLHGDFRNGNLLVHPQAGVVAVLDWEIAHRGDPAEDLGWICVNSWRFGRPDRPVGGFGSYADLLAGYASVSGRDIPLATVRAWQALGSLKWGVMCLTMYGSYASGENRSVERPMIGRRVSEVEIDLLALLR